MKWPNKDKIGGETKQLLAYANNNRMTWSRIAKRLNEYYGNNRSAAACRHKVYRENEKWIRDHPSKWGI